jgi:TM2 domain-containing membrane protein YozV
MENKKNNSGTAAVLSFIFSGLGQLYNGEIIKGLWIIFFTSLSLLSVILGALLIYFWLIQKIGVQLLWLGIALFVFGLVAICIIGIYSIFDAYKGGENK